MCSVNAHEHERCTRSRVSRETTAKPQTPSSSSSSSSTVLSSSSGPATPKRGPAIAQRRRCRPLVGGVVLIGLLLVAQLLLLVPPSPCDGMLFIRPVGAGMLRWLRSSAIVAQQSAPNAHRPPPPPSSALPIERLLRVHEGVVVSLRAAERTAPAARRRIDDDEDGEEKVKKVWSETEAKSDEEKSGPSAEEPFSDAAATPDEFTSVGRRNVLVLPINVGGGANSLSAMAAAMQHRDDADAKGFESESRQNDDAEEEEEYLMNVVSMMRRICTQFKASASADDKRMSFTAATSAARHRATRGGGVAAVGEIIDKIQHGRSSDDVVTQALIARFCHHAPMVRNG